MFAHLVRSDEGADATEYAFLASLIALAIIVGAQALGAKLSLTYNTIQNSL